jgi:hypothetical protein
MSTGMMSSLFSTSTTKGWTFKGGVDLTKGGNISSFISAIISIIRKKRQPRSRLSPISFVEVEQAIFALFPPKRTVFLTKTAANLVKLMAHVLQTPPAQKSKSGVVVQLAPSLHELIRTQSVDSLVRTMTFFDGVRGRGVCATVGGEASHGVLNSVGRFSLPIIRS